MKNKEKTLTTGEAAKYCDVNFRTVIRWIEKGYLKAYKLPGRGDNRIPVDSFLSFLEENNMPVPRELLPQNKRVLIVEDVPEMAKAIERTLKRAGYETLIALNGFEAGEMLHRFEPFLMTLDIQMPGLSGFDVIRYVRQNSTLNDLKIIVVSAQEQSELDKTIRLGANAVLSKPFSNAELLSLVEST